jgi:6-phosphogluconolactonase
MEYEEELFEYFGTDDLPATTFDLVLLGMGDDGHTLSLFPGEPIVHEEKLWVSSYFLKAQDMYRITLTKNIVNRSNHIVFMVSGSEKAYAVRGRAKKPRPFHCELLLSGGTFYGRSCSSSTKTSTVS